MVRDLMAAHDPASGVRTGTEALNQARIDALSRAETVRVPRPAPRRRAWRALALSGAAGVIAVAVVGGLVGGREETAYAGPPPAPLAVEVGEVSEAGPELLELAERAEEQPVEEPAGDVAYQHKSTWHLTLSQDLDTGKQGWGIVPEDVQTWSVPSGNGGLEISRPDVPDHLEGDEQPLLSLFEDGVSEIEGGDVLNFSWEPGTLSTDPDTLAHQLIEEADANWSDEVTTAALWFAITQLYEDQPVEPAVQGAVLRMLAERDDVGFAGEAEDRSGRPGLLFVVRTDEPSGAGTEDELRMMFDAETGMPLYHETVLLEDPEAEYDLPAVGQYTMFHTSTWVSEVRETP
ncbi:CU044_5270 family protein [Nocardiopsis sediminis]|uniref:CU044_5270 family protein n=1 Tax=Nocardiopsis sediminis TaxID=1778267 RepID=A0ABV8FNM8_9ACTN